jgi:hypothetical protein
VAELVDDEVLVDVRALEQDEVTGRVPAEAPEAWHPEQPGGDHQPDAVQINRLGIQPETIEASLRAP